MSKRSKTVREYLSELRETKKDKPGQIRDALDIYLELWESVMDRGVVGGDDTIDEALSKVEAKGGLYRAASEQPSE